MTTIAETLAEFVVDLSLKDVPGDVLSLARMHLLDSIGVALGSGPMPYARAVHDAALASGRGADSTALCFGTQLPAASAALVNGTLIHGLDFDDPEILALAERTWCPDDPASEYPARFPGEVRITLTGGRVIARREVTSRGTPERPLSADELAEKFIGNATRTIGLVPARELQRRVLAIDEEPDLSGLVRAATGRVPTGARGPRE